MRAERRSSQAVIHLHSVSGKVDPQSRLRNFWWNFICRKVYLRQQYVPVLKGNVQTSRLLQCMLQPTARALKLLYLPTAVRIAVETEVFPLWIRGSVHSIDI